MLLERKKITLANICAIIIKCHIANAA